MEWRQTSHLPTRNRTQKLQGDQQLSPWEDCEANSPWSHYQAHKGLTQVVTGNEQHGFTQSKSCSTQLVTQVAVQIRGKQWQKGKIITMRVSELEHISQNWWTLSSLETKLKWTQPWATCSTCPCLEYGVDLEISRGLHISVILWQMEVHNTTELLVHLENNWDSNCFKC